MTKEIALSQGKCAAVDDEDFEWVSKFKWHYHHTGYACRSQYLGMIDGKMKVKTFSMHREIMKVSSSVSVDHRDMNTLNNQKDNLRLATRSENGMNRKSYSGSHSKYKGVGWAAHAKKWTASIKHDQKRKHLGYFVNEEDAAKAYNDAALKYFGEFSRLNSMEKNT